MWEDPDSVRGSRQVPSALLSSGRGLLIISAASVCPVLAPCRIYSWTALGNRRTVTGQSREVESPRLGGVEGVVADRGVAVVSSPVSGQEARE